VREVGRAPSETATDIAGYRSKLIDRVADVPDQNICRHAEVNEIEPIGPIWHSAPPSDIIKRLLD
jgi:hypothetical protein